MASAKGKRLLFEMSGSSGSVAQLIFVVIINQFLNKSCARFLIGLEFEYILVILVDSKLLSILEA